MSYVALVVSPGYHGQTEHRVSYIDEDFVPNQEYDQLLPHLSASAWIATYSVAKEKATKFSLIHQCTIKEFHFDESFYAVRKRANR